MTSDIKFAPVPISKIVPNKELPTDIYVQVGDKYIKFKYKGDEISGEKYDYFISKHIKSIHITTSQIPLFMDWMKSTKVEADEKMVDKVGEENRELVEQSANIAEKVYETFSDMELTPTLVKALQQEVTGFVEEVSKDKAVRFALAKLTKHNRGVADHSVNVANLATFFAMALGHDHHDVLEEIYMGAVFHDYGKAKISRTILENPNNTMYSQSIQDHPIKGVASLKKIKGMSRKVINIVAQHHEQYNGKGYPRGLAGEDIYDLSKIVSLANIVDHALSDNSQLAESEMYKKTIKILERDKGKCIDPEILPRALDALKCAYGISS